MLRNRTILLKKARGNRQRTDIRRTATVVTEARHNDFESWLDDYQIL